jgi:ketosteroid isomerase-like protein
MVERQRHRSALHSAFERRTQGPSQGDDDDEHRRQAGIQEIIAQYSYTYDGKDAEGFAQLFVEDGVFEVFVPGKTTASVRLQSRTEILEWATQRLHERTGRFTSRHYQSGILFDELTSDSALTRTMVLVTHQGVAEAAPHPTISGVYHDQWRKTHTGWRLAHRAAHVDGDPGFSK